MYEFTTEFQNFQFCVLQAARKKKHRAVRGQARVMAEVTDPHFNSHDPLVGDPGCKGHSDVALVILARYAVLPDPPSVQSSGGVTQCVHVQGAVGPVEIVVAQNGLILEVSAT